MTPVEDSDEAPPTEVEGLSRFDKDLQDFLYDAGLTQHTLAFYESKLGGVYLQCLCANSESRLHSVNHMSPSTPSHLTTFKWCL